jgi:hypothetical protein
MFKYSKKVTTYSYVIYATPKKCGFKFDLHLEIQKKINLGVNSVNYYPSKAGTIHNKIFFVSLNVD